MTNLAKYVMFTLEEIANRAMIMIMNLYSAFSIFIYSNALYKQVIYGQRPDHNLPFTMSVWVLYSLNFIRKGKKRMKFRLGSLTSPASQYSDDAGDGSYGLSSLSEKTRISDHLQMSLQRQHRQGGSQWD